MKDEQLVRDGPESTLFAVDRSLIDSRVFGGKVSPFPARRARHIHVRRLSEDQRFARRSFVFLVVTEADWSKLP